MTKAEKHLRKVEVAFPGSAAELTRRQEERLAVEEKLQASRELVVLGLRDARGHEKEVVDLEAKLAAAVEAEEWQPPSFVATEEAREAAEIARKDRAEAVDWWARSYSLSPEEWPNHLREEIGERIDLLRAENKEYRHHLGKRSREGLEAAGLDAASISEEIAVRLFLDA